MKIVLFKNTVESQEFFSYELEKAFRELGHDTYMYDCAYPLHSFKSLKSFVEPGNTGFFGFNFNGMINDPYLVDKDKEPVFLNRTGIPYINMVVDHPYYYHQEFAHVPENYRQLSIDGNHIRYMKRFFPKINADTYMELAGTELSGEKHGGRDYIENIPRLRISERPDDIIFTGNYILPESYEKFIKDCDQAVKDFYHDLFRFLISNPSMTLEDAAELKIRQAFGDEVTDDYLRECYENMIFLDLQVRHHFRGLAIKTLADAGFKITVYGAGYEELPLRHPENIINKGNVNSEKCLEATASAKISLNVMPWFKDGAHDRVFNTMLNGAVCLSDHSRALDHYFTEGRDIAFFDLEHMDRLPEIYENLITDPGHMQEMADMAYEYTRSHHTWKNRAIEILKIFEEMMA